YIPKRIPVLTILTCKGDTCDLALGIAGDTPFAVLVLPASRARWLVAGRRAVIRVLPLLTLTDVGVAELDPVRKCRPEHGCRLVRYFLAERVEVVGQLRLIGRTPRIVL